MNVYRFHLLLVLFCTQVVSRADESRLDVARMQVQLNAHESINSDERIPQSSCGVFAACRAVVLAGGNAEPQRFQAKDYIGSRSGSTPQQVLRIIHECGLKGLPLTNLTKVDVLLLGQPIIANVRQSPSGGVYDHWVCVVASNGRLMVYDGNSAAVDMPIGQFMAIWSGYGIVVTHTPWLDRSLLIATRIGFILACAVTFFAVRKGLSRMKSRKSQVALGAASFAAIVLLGNLTFCDLSGGLTPFVAAASTERDFPVVDLESAPLEAYVLIDARYVSTYERGSLEKAINIPVDTPLVEVERIFSTVDRGLPILVFCHSQTCEYDVNIAGKLKCLGFSNVSVSKNGWVEYKEAQEQQKSIADANS